MPINFDNVKGGYTGESYISANGDTVRTFTTTGAKPGLLYLVQYRMKKDGSEPILTTREESGELMAGPEVRISNTSDWGRTLNNTFLAPARQLPISKDLTKMPFWKLWLYKTVGYNLQGGTINYLDLFKK